MKMMKMREGINKKVRGEREYAKKKKKKKWGGKGEDKRALPKSAH